MLRAKINDVEGNNLPDLIVCRAREANVARTRKSLQACSDIDAVTEEVAALDHDIADMDADAEVNATVGRRPFVSFCQRSLCFDRALNGIHRAAELRQHTVPSGIGDPAAMRGNQAVKDGPALCQIPQGPDLVGAHQAAIAFDIRRENRD